MTASRGTVSDTKGGGCGGLGAIDEGGVMMLRGSNSFLLSLFLHRCFQLSRAHYVSVSPSDAPKKGDW